MNNDDIRKGVHVLIHEYKYELRVVKRIMNTLLLKDDRHNKLFYSNVKHVKEIIKKESEK